MPKSSGEIKTQATELESQSPNLSEPPHTNDNNLCGIFSYGLGASLPFTVTGAFLGYVFGLFADIEQSNSSYYSPTAAIGAAAGATAAMAISGFFAGKHAKKQGKSGFCQGARGSADFIIEKMQYSS